jgi:hypothetical protein|nr:MAG TPA: hemolysin [Caudoviricetes sp.]
MSEPISKTVFEATLNPIRSQLDKIDGKVDQLLENQHDQSERLVAAEKDIAKNTNEIEAIKAILKWGGAAVGVAIIGAIMKGVLK